MIILTFLSQQLNNNTPHRVRPYKMNDISVNDGECLTRCCCWLLLFLLAGQRTRVDGHVSLWDLIRDGRLWIGCRDVTVAFSPVVPLSPDAIQEFLQRLSRSRSGELHWKLRKHWMQFLAGKDTFHHTGRSYSGLEVGSTDIMYIFRSVHRFWSKSQ